MNLDQTYTIDFNNLSFYDGDFRKSDDFSDLIHENDGSVCREEEWICYNPTGNDDVFITIEYTLNLSGYFDECPGDYWTEGSSSTKVTCDDIHIYKVKIDFVEVEITKELENVLKSLIRKQIDC